MSIAPLAWQQPLWGSLAQIGGSGGGGPATTGASFMLFSRLESPITSGYENIPGLGDQADGLGGFTAPYDMRLKAFSERVTRSGGYRADTEFSVRIDSVATEIVTVPAATEGWRIHEVDIAISAGEYVELVYDCGNNFNMGIGLAYYFEADTDGDSAGPFWIAGHDSGLSASDEALHFGGNSANYNVFPVAPRTFVIRDVGYGLASAAAADHTVYVARDGVLAEIGTLSSGQTSAVLNDVDEVVLKGEVFGIYANGGAASEPAVLATASCEFPTKTDQNQHFCMVFTDQDANAAQAIHRALIRAPEAGTITEVHLISTAGFTGQVTVSVNGGAANDLWDDSASAGTPSESSPNFSFNAGDTLEFAHTGVGTTSASLSVVFFIETENADDYESPSYTAPVADQPAGDSREMSISQNTENTGYNNSKGYYVLCKEDRWLTGINARLGASSMTCFYTIAECDYAYDIVDITHQTASFTSVDGWNQVDLDTPVLLEAGKIYMVQATRTDLDRVIVYQDSDPVDVDEFFPWVGQIAAHNDVDPAIGENFLNTAASGDNGYAIQLIHEKTAQRDTFKLWGIRMEGSDDGTYHSIAQVVFRESAGGTDVADANPVYASAYDDGFEPDNALDANSSTRWRITDANFDAGDRILKVRFDDPRDIVEVDISSVDDGNHDETPTDFTVVYSEDGITWYDAFSVSGESAWASDETRTFTRSGLPADPALSPHQYWAVIAPESSNGAYVHIAELEMRESASGSDVTTTGFAIAGSERSGFEATYAFDDIVSGSNSWGVAKASAVPIDRYVGQNFGSGNEKTIIEVAITTRDDSNEEQAPHAAIVAWSDDGVTWYPSWVIDDKTSWSAAEQRVYTRP